MFMDNFEICLQEQNFTQCILLEQLTSLIFELSSFWNNYKFHGLILL